MHTDQSNYSNDSLNTVYSVHRFSKLAAVRKINPVLSAVSPGGVQDGAEAWRVYLGGQEEGETFYRAAQRTEDLQDLHEDTTAISQVCHCTQTHDKQQKYTHVRLCTNISDHLFLPYLTNSDTSLPVSCSARRRHGDPKKSTEPSAG